MPPSSIRSNPYGAGASPPTVANGCARTEAQLRWLARQGLRQAQRRKATLVAAFWKQADLSF